MIEDLIVRAVVFFTGRVENHAGLVKEIDEASSLLSSVEDILKKFSLKVFSKRVSLPGLSKSLAHRLTDLIKSDTLFSVGYAKLSPFDAVDLASSGVYVPILHASEPSIEAAKIYSKVIHRASEVKPECASRISIGFHGEDFYTPYYPDSSSRGVREIGLSFIYPKIILKGLSKGCGINDALQDAFRFFKIIADEVALKLKLRVRIDYSLSPWMENSVAEIYEYAGFSVNGVGATYYTWLLNRAIDKNADLLLKTGFNEVMLPYAEDNLLKRLGEEGAIRAKDFLTLALTCVSGVDMIVVPVDETKLSKLIASVNSIAYVKGKPMSFRAIVVPEKPGNSVDLGKFGKTTVMDY